MIGLKLERNVRENKAHPEFQYHVVKAGDEIVADVSEHDFGAYVYKVGNSDVTLNEIEDFVEKELKVSRRQF